jgi:hypothetical protein
LARFVRARGVVARPALQQIGQRGQVVDFQVAILQSLVGVTIVGIALKASSSLGGFHGSGYWWANAAQVADGATFSFYLSAAATKTIDAHWTSASDRAPSAPFVMFDAQGKRLGAVTVDQRTNGGKWNTLGSYAFTAGWNKIVLSRWTGGSSVVVADAVRVR